MAFKWPEYVPFANQAFPGLELAFTVKPSYVEGKPAIFNHSDTWNLVGWAGTPNPDAALDFMTYCASKEVQRAMLEQNPGISPLKEINFDPQEEFFQTGKGAYLAPVLNAIKAGQLRYYGPFGNMDTLEYSIMWPMINQMLQGELTVQQTLEQMEASLNEEMALYQARYSDLEPVEIYWDGIPASLMQGIPMEGNS
jgi:ABC-type glycerol-3-phosphate transport system substrate-binding protein